MIGINVMAKNTDDWGDDESQELVKAKYISGFPTDKNLDKWASYAKRNSYGDNNANARATSAS